MVKRKNIYHRERGCAKEIKGERESKIEGKRGRERELKRDDRTMKRKIVSYRKRGCAEDQKGERVRERGRERVINHE